MIIYLYVKTHNVTGLKYLGKTSRTNPHEYQGSGIYWRSHLKKHGKDYSTEIIKECNTKEELKFWGLYYSNLWNVVDAKSSDGHKLWANLKPENGDGGSLPGELSHRYGKVHSSEARHKMSLRTVGKTVSKETRDKMSASRKGQPGRPRTDQEKILLSKVHKGKVVTEETKQKTALALTGKPKSEEHKRKLREIGATNRKMISTPDGIFESRDAAAKFYKIKPESMGGRIKRNPDKYRYC